jgi:hypothetical protein
MGVRNQLGPCEIFSVTVHCPLCFRWMCAPDMACNVAACTLEHDLTHPKRKFEKQPTNTTPSSLARKARAADNSQALQS